MSKSLSQDVQRELEELGANRDERHLPLLKNVSCTPVFIIAMPRSGGTLLYDLFRKTGAFNVMTVEEKYQIKISDKDAGSLRTIGQAVDFVCQRAIAR